jgi:hypothetical protein
MVFGQFVDILQDTTQPTTGRCLRVREIDDSDIGEPPLAADILLDALPAVSLAEDVEPQLPSDLELVGRHRRRAPRQHSGSCARLRSAPRAERPALLLVGDQNVGRDDTGDQIVTALLGLS